MGSFADVAPAEAFPPGEYLADELDARGWSIADFADIIGRPVQVVSEIINGRKAVTPQTATEIAAATATSAETWLRLQSVYDLWRFNRGSGPTTQSPVSRRARLAALVPVRELVARGDLPEGDLDAQESEVCRLLGLASLDEAPRFALAARRSGFASTLSPAQLAWVALARRSTATIDAPPFDQEGFAVVVERLSRTVAEPSDIADLPRRFAAVGVRLTYVPFLSGSKIDGAAYWDDGPAIALSGRMPSLDSILFTLLHECAHLTLGHVDGGQVVDEDLSSPSTLTNEQTADELARAWSIPGPVTVTAPFSRKRVEAEAKRLGVHPALVVGRLQYERHIPWRNLNGLKPSARDALAEW